MTWEPDYITTAQLRKNNRNVIDADETELATAITAASRAVDLLTKRQFGQLAVVEPRYYTPWYDEDLRRWVCEIDDTFGTAGFAVDLDLGDDDTYSTALTSADWILRPRNAASKLRPYTQLAIKNTASQPLRRSDSVRAIEKWGWTSVPTTIVNACKLQASRFYERRDMPFGVKGSPEGGDEQSILDRVDPDVELMLKPYQRLVRA